MFQLTPCSLYRYTFFTSIFNEQMQGKGNLVHNPALKSIFAIAGCIHKLYCINTLVFIVQRTTEIVGQEKAHHAPNLIFKFSGFFLKHLLHYLLLQLCRMFIFPCCFFPCRLFLCALSSFPRFAFISKTYYFFFSYFAQIAIGS